MPQSHPKSTMLSVARPQWEPKAFRWWYDAIIDWMIANPGGTMKACGQELGRSPVTLGMVVASDLFKARYAERRGSLNDAFNDAIMLKTSKVAVAALDELQHRLKNKPQSIPSATLADIASSSMESLGFGAPKAGQAVPTQEVHVHVGGDILASARERMRTIEGQKLDEGRTPAASRLRREIEMVDTAAGGGE